MLDRMLDRPVSVTMILLVFMVLGIVGIRRLPVSLAPDVDVPYLTVQVSEHDMSAYELENIIVRPIRQNLAQLDHLKDIRSEVTDGRASIRVEFDEGQDMDLSYIEVNESIDRVMGGLPRVDRPKVFRAGATDIPAFYLNVTLKDGRDFLELSEFAEDVISRRLEQLPEVAMVDITGVADREVLVIPDQKKLSGLGLTLAEFQNSITSANVSLGNLTVRDGEYHYNVRFRSYVATSGDVADVFFKAGGRLLQIKDVAQVIEHEAPRQGYALSDGKDAVVLAIIKQSEARMSALRRSVSEQVTMLSSEYPRLEFKMTRDQTELLDYSINNLLKSIILAVILVCIVLFFFMKDLRMPVLVAMTIPVSLLVSFFIFYLIGLSINIVSLSGMLLGVGMMVDNAIILTDNISAEWQKRKNLRTAIVRGTYDVMGAMLSSVLTTCAVFLPLLLMDGLAGNIFHDQAMSVSIVLLTSFAVTVTVIPVYYRLLYRRSAEFRPNRILSRITFPAALRIYDRLEDFFLENRLICWLIPAVSALVTVFCVISMDRERLPAMTYSDTILRIDWNEHVTVEQNRARIAMMEEEISDAVLQLTSMVGSQQFVMSHTSEQGIGEASVYFKCENAERLNREKEHVLSWLAGHYPSAIAEFSNSGNIFEMIFAEKEPRLLARLRPSGGTAMNPDRLEGLLEDISAALTGVRIDPVPVKRNVLFVSDPELMSIYGVSYSSLLSVLRNALNGNELFELVQGSRTVPVVMGTDIVGLEDILARETVQVADGDRIVEIPLSSLMRQTFERDLKSIVAGEDGVYYPLNLEIPSGDVPEVMAAVRKVVLEEDDFDVGFSGSWFSNMEMMKQMSMVLAVAIALLYLILASQFESLLQPLVILSELVVDIAFSLLFSWIFGISINIMSLIGLVVITGIVINDSILKIDTINKLVQSGMEVSEAIHEAGHRRIKAIIMTSLTTILAMSPSLVRGSMGSDLQYPMAVVMIIGMTTGTLVSLFYVPAVYYALYRKRR